MPVLFISADHHAQYWQTRFFQLQRLQLGSLMVAAVGGTTSWTLNEVRVSAVLAALGFATAAMARLAMLQQQPLQKWQDGRAAAESAKSLAWRFAVGGTPFERSLSHDEAVDLFTERILELTRELTSLARPAGDDRQITDEMRQLRAASLTDRRSAYFSGRLDDQQQWYSKRSKSFDRRSRAWNQILIVLDVAAMTAAIVRVVGWIEIDLIGLLATVSAVSVAWYRAKQYDALARSYAVASQEIAAVRDQIAGVRTEANWAEAVGRAEEPISREHTLWRASRGSAV